MRSHPHPFTGKERRHSSARTTSKGVASGTTYDVEEMNLSVGCLDLATPGDDDVRVEDLAPATVVGEEAKVYGHFGRPR